MKYYRLRNSVNTKEIGRHALQTTFADKKTLDSSCSLVSQPLNSNLTCIVIENN